MAWGNQKKTTIIPQVEAYVWDEDERVRAGVALTFGQLIAEKTVDDQVEQALQQLGNLSCDRAPLVRQCAVQSLGKIRSEAVIPFLTRALQDADLDVVASASAILNNYKTDPRPSATASEPTLPENSALKAQNQSL